MLVLLSLSGLLFGFSSITKYGFINQYLLLHSPVPSTREPEFYRRLAQAAESQLSTAVTYSSAYYPIAYPMGDIPAHLGVCSDVVIRAYRALGIDLQQQVHQDMAQNFMAYPKIWRLLKPDTHIDHRRVPNLMTFFNRAGASLPLSLQPEDYLPGDLVAWDIGQSLTHIGLISDKKSEQSGAPLIIHNIGAGVQQEDKLFAYRIIGHYRYRP